MSDEAVYLTAPATLGLLNKMIIQEYWNLTCEGLVGFGQLYLVQQGKICFG